MIADSGRSGSVPGLRRRRLLAAGINPLVIAPAGGQLPDGTAIQRTFLTARSVEFDALLLAGSPPPAPDAVPLRDSRAGEPDPVGLDPRVGLLVLECFRQAKALGGWGAGADALETVVGAAPGVITGQEPAVLVETLQELMGTHRVWERFPVSTALG